MVIQEISLRSDEAYSGINILQFLCKTCSKKLDKEHAIIFPVAAVTLYTSVY